MRPGAMYTYTTTGRSRPWYFSSLFTLIEFSQAFRSWIIQAHIPVPFFMYSFVRYFKITLGCIAITFHFFIGKSIISEDYRVSGEPAKLVIHIQLVIGF